MQLDVAISDLDVIETTENYSLYLLVIAYNDRIEVFWQVAFSNPHSEGS